MAVLGLLFFSGVFVISLWALATTIAPRRSYIAALLSGSGAAPVLVPVARRRRVRQIKPIPIQATTGLMRRAVA